MKVIYTKENFMHINTDYPGKQFNVFFDDIEYTLNLDCEADYLNIPVYNYSLISFEKQYAKYVSIGNQRKLTAEAIERNERYDVKIYKTISYAEFTNGNPNNLVILFPESTDYLEQYIDSAISNIKPDSKLLIIFDDFLQYGSNLLFRNNGEPLFDTITSFISEKANGFDDNCLTFVGSRNGAKIAKMYGSFFPNAKIVSFNTDYKNMLKEVEVYTLRSRGVTFAPSFEFTSFSEERLKPEHKSEERLLINTDLYSFEETMRLSFYFAQINNNFKTEIELGSYSLIFDGDYCKLPDQIAAKPLFITFSDGHLYQRISFYSEGRNYYLIDPPLLLNTNCLCTIYTEEIIYKFDCEVIR